MLEFIRDADAFLAGASAQQAQADCDLTRSALGLRGSGTEDPRDVWLLSEWLDSHAWWRERAEDAVRHHCADCPAVGCKARSAAARELQTAPLMLA